MRTPILAPLLLAACGPDLPEGWEEAERVDAFVQAECDGNPYEEVNERFTADLEARPVTIDVKEAHFRCAQDLEGYFRWGADDALLVLVQPIDMKPDVVAGCDCLYDLGIGVEVDRDPAEVAVYRRWDNLNDDNDPVEIPPGD